MDQYVSWCFSAEELTLDKIWGKFEEFCKPQSNEVRAHFDLPTSFRQGSRSVDEWYNVVQAQINLTKHPPKQPRFYIMIHVLFFLCDEEFVPKTINDGNVDLEKVPACRAGQLVKRMESSKATTKHIKQVAGDPQAAQINLMMHQHTELSSGKYKKKKPFVTSRQPSHKNAGNDNQQVLSYYKKSFSP